MITATALILIVGLATMLVGGAIWTARCTKCNDCCCDGNCEQEQD